MSRSFGLLRPLPRPEIALQSLVALLLAFIQLALALQAPPDAAALTLNQTGKWTPTTTWAGTAVHLVLLPGYGGTSHSRVIWWYGLGHHDATFGGLFGWSEGEYDCQSYPTSQFSSRTFDYPDNDGIFCGSNSMTPQGLLVAGGTQPGTENGMRHTWFYDPTTELWSRRDSMAAHRWYATSTTLSDGKSTLALSGSRFLNLHFFSGRISGAAPSDTAIWRYELWGTGLNRAPVRASSTPIWPKPREGHTGMYDNATSAMHLFGGKDAAGDPLGDAWLLRRLANDRGADYDYAWDPLSPSPDSLAGSPTARYEHAVAIVDTSKLNTMYVIGGIEKNPLGQEVATKDVWRLWRNIQVNPAVWHWKKVAILSSSDTLVGLRCGHTAFFDHTNRRILLFGGRNSPTASPTDNDMWSFQLSTDSEDEGTWSKLTGVQGTKPSARFDHAIAWDQGLPPSTVFVFGGELGGGTKDNELWKFDVQSLTWTKVTWLTGTPPSARSAATLIDGGGGNILYLFGGSSTDATVYRARVVSLPPGAQATDWQAHTTMDVPLQNTCAWRADGGFSRVAEIYDSVADDWTSATAPRLQEWYPQAFVTGPSGNVFVSGPADTSLFFRLATEDWQTSSVTPGFKGGSAVMYRPGKVMKCGSRDTDVIGEPAVGTTRWINAAAGSPQWTASANSMLPRVNHNLVLLPTGQVFVTGGTDSVDNSTPRGPVWQPEIWDPDWPVNQGRWYGRDTLAADSVIRDYHSVSLLLPDSRILCASGNKPGQKEKANIFCPPYLFKANGNLATRPDITDHVRYVRYGRKFSICISSDTLVNRACLIRPGATTHGFDENQRYAPLTLQSSIGDPGYISVTAPADSFAAPPGDYLLFVLNGRGTPAVAEWVRVGSEWTSSDVTSPARIDSASISSDFISSNSIAYSWPGPGDDGSTGVATQYELRYFTSPIDNSNFSGCWGAPNPPSPACPGTTQNFQLTGLQACTNYWIGIKVADENNNKSTLTTFGPIQSSCGGGGGGFAATQAMDESERSRGRDRTALSTRAVDGGDGTTLIAELNSASDLTWTVSRVALDAVPDLPEELASGVLVQRRDESGQWRSREYFEDLTGRVGLRRFARDGRVVFVGQAALEAVETSHGGFALDVASSSIPEDAVDPAALEYATGDVAAGTPLTFKFNRTTSADASPEDCFLTVSLGSPNATYSGGRVGLDRVRPLEFELHQSQPNPSAGGVAFRFDLPAASNARLEIFDLLGRRIATVVDGPQEAGSHTVQWSRRGARGQRLAAGVYVYRLTAGDHRAERKMVLN